jgi:hypothetical protein
MRALNSLKHRFALRQVAQLIILCAVTIACGAIRLDTCAFAQAQANAADLRGYVRDPQNAAVPNATVTARNPATDFVRTTTTNNDGFYQLINLPPGVYQVTAEAPNFTRAVLPNVTLTVGQAASLDIPLQIGNVGESVTVNAANTDIVETERTAVADTIDQQRIDNLPINQRDYINFSLTVSTVTRDNARPIGPAPTSGLNFGGQRGRSNLIQVDGADNTDNSVNAARSTVSQEAVQEFQVVTNSFAPEFGRSSGGVVNVVTKSGTNDLRGDIFGFIRHRSIQARNPFAPVIDPNDPGKKPPFTRTQYGGTIGGALAKDRTFFFASFEQRRRQETGFFTSNVALGLNGSYTINALPAVLGSTAALLPVAQTYTGLTAAQVAYISGLDAQGRSLINTGLSTGNATAIQNGVNLIGLATSYAYLASSGSATALKGQNPLVVLPLVSQRVTSSGITPLAPGGIVGGNFLLSGAPVPVNQLAFRPLTTLSPVFPIKEATTFSSLRIDHRINDNNLFYFRVGYNRSFINGIQVESQNQSLGQNDFSRTGVQVLRDPSFVATLNSTISPRLVNEARFNFGRRRAAFTSGVNGEVAANISGTAFIGQELFSPVDRTETRYEFTDNINYVAGNHTFKFGGDYATIGIRYRFDLNFAGVYNFGGLTATTLNSAFAGAPDFTPVQQYGLGFPSNYIQGFGNPFSSYRNRPVAAFAQDTWKIRPNITLNYGVRYDVEFTQQIAPIGFTDPLSKISLSAADVQAAQDAVNAQQGIPRDTNNFAPRIGVAWDIKGNGKTVLRAAYGIFYDHPLLAIAANSDIADAAQQQQGVLLPGSPSPTALLNSTQIFQGTVIPGTTPGVASGAQYQTGRQRFNDQTFPGFGAVLPFILPVAKDFQYAYANQANLTLERQLTKNMSVSVSYLFVGAHHLPHPLDVNAPDTSLQIANFRRYAGRDPISTTEAIAFSIPSAPSASLPFYQCSLVNPSLPLGTICYNNPTAGPNQGQPFMLIIPGMIAAPLANPTNRVIAPAIANFFRPSAPNYFLAQALSGGLVTPAVLNSQLAGTLRAPGVISPFGAVDEQVSDGNSVYHAGTIEVRRRFANNFEFLASYTYSHAIDDSSDLQTLLLPQDNRNFRLERADSLFDQRHRFVFSGVLSAPSGFRGAGGVRSFLAGFILAPIVEISSGRPFNILSNVDTNNDQSNQTDRPSVTSSGTLCIPGATNCTPLIVNNMFATGNLGRNRGILQGYASFDMRVAKTIPFNEHTRLEIIAEGFNLFNRFNEAAASPFIDDVNAYGQRDKGGRYYSRPTAAFDPRQFQFALKFYF